ncbi:MAG: YceI family protein [Chloroflexota bacterium]
MSQKSITMVLSIFVIALLAACAPVAPEASQDTTASQPAATETPVPEEEPAEETASSDDGEDASYTVDTAASTVAWKGSKPIGDAQTGTINISEGEMSFSGSEFVSGAVTIDMTTMASTNLSGGMADRLIGHLSSDDFFGVETYPTSMLVIKSAEPTDVENQYLVTADLTIKETTNEITFNTDVTVADGTITANADIVFDRAEFDIQYGSGSFFDNLGDDLISDEIEMTVMLVANQ